MKEKDLYTPFSKYIATSYKGPTAVFELKLVRGKSLKTYDFKPHQLRALSMAKHNAIYHKLPDTSLTASPFDCFYIHKGEAYAVIVFDTDPHLAYFIDIDVLLEGFEANKKGLTKDNCQALSKFTSFL